jgi:hypothetical protein
LARDSGAVLLGGVAAAATESRSRALRCYGHQRHGFGTDGDGAGTAAPSARTRHRAGWPRTRTRSDRSTAGPAEAMLPPGHPRSVEKLTPLADTTIGSSACFGQPVNVSRTAN